MTAPAAPAISPAESAGAARVATAGQWRLMWWRFRRHKLAMLGLVVTTLIYLTAIFAGFVAPVPPDKTNARYTYAPPQAIHFLGHDGFAFAPHVHGYKVELDPVALRRTFVVDPEKIIPIGLFVKGPTHTVLGLLETDRHLFGPVNPRDPFFLLGADRLGRDVFSRTVFGAQISMSIGLVGVTLSLIIGTLLGGLSGYLGGWVDASIQRLIEVIRSIPTIPLWMGLAASVPLTWHPLAVYFAITIILSLVGWTTIARIVRGKFLSLREEDFVTAAILDGAPRMRVITVHMLPSMTSYIIAATTLAIPIMILSETALSFIGLGLQPPLISWGVLLKEAQNIRSLATAPWLLAPGIAVVVAVLSLSFLGDGLRDAADPYQR
ncbi:ABC transporter permease [Acuticoccus kandeliae]|uniref:ABC transporter permease n=1 Tax=Acuticoccus kandeliae TaxID=2073160 RepID=UPI000D3E4B6F|nr:ABC transporter permease [Acuticoccus kandeliae]